MIEFNPAVHPLLVVTLNGCWEYDGHPIAKGYTKMAAGATTMPAHAAFYAVFVGPVQRGMQVHHRCHNPKCVNPAHLVALWPQQHRDEHYVKPTECPLGHPYPENEYRDAGGRLRCKVCTAERKRVAKMRAKARRLWRCRFCGSTGGEEAFPLVGKTTRTCACGRGGRALERLDHESAA